MQKFQLVIECVNGQVSVSSNVQDTLILYGMIEAAKVAIGEQMKKNAEGAKVETAPAGLIGILSNSQPRS